MKVLDDLVGDAVKASQMNPALEPVRILLGVVAELEGKELDAEASALLVEILASPTCRQHLAHVQALATQGEEDA